ncbi:MAG TPA: hydantoinase/oxoprolinase family protein [Negativicutes bacterium]|nr:hydantoinase/oxoprolinase family protein [Negativicutes bacterium]
MDGRAIRVGIDVGGTHTKAVAIDNATNAIVGKASVMTTHDDDKGVAAGVVQAFEKCLAENGIKADEVVFIAHSTTQATNALLEGDVAKVGVFGIGKGLIEGFLTKRQTRIDDIDLGTGKFIRTCHTYRKRSQLNPDELRQAIGELAADGASVIVASKAFGVDGMAEEKLVQDAAEAYGLQCTAASEITKLYGLTTRTRTATINASILPKMLETASSTEASVKKAGIKVPLMIMRGDGGVMEVAEMKKRPVLTMLSGPAASVVGALMYLRASNGIYFEVGGTSTNIGVIKNGRPTVDYSIVGGHRTYINSLDVRVLGVAGGSMVRVNNGQLVDVGPRSAHIAGMGYAAFTPEEEIEDPQVYFVRPKKDDPDDYVAIKLKNGKSVTITNTCAANVLGLVPPGDFASGNARSCSKAMAPLASLLGLTVEETAVAILRKATDKIIPVIRELAEKYKLEEDQMVLVGVGGGAASLLPFTADALGLQYKIPENAEVISSIGVALAMVREMVERVEPNPTAETIAAIKKEAAAMAINSGAVPDTVEVFVELNPQAQKITAIAMGSTEIRTTDLVKKCTLEEAREIAAESLGLPPGEVAVEAANPHLFVFSAAKDGKHNLRVVDKRGFVKVQRRDGLVLRSPQAEAADNLKQVWSKACSFNSDIMIIPDIYVIAGSRIHDYSGMTKLEPIKELLVAELAGGDENEELIIIGAKNDI